MNINQQIAKKKGLDFVLSPDSSPVIFKPGVQYKPIDYTKDPARILELELELLEAGWMIEKHENEYHWRENSIGDEIKWFPQRVHSKDFGMATALAWLEENDGLVNLEK